MNNSKEKTKIITDADKLPLDQISKMINNGRVDVPLNRISSHFLDKIESCYKKNMVKEQCTPEFISKTAKEMNLSEQEVIEIFKSINDGDEVKVEKSKEEFKKNVFKITKK